MFSCLKTEIDIESTNFEDALEGWASVTIEYDDEESLEITKNSVRNWFASIKYLYGIISAQELVETKIIYSK